MSDWAMAGILPLPSGSTFDDVIRAVVTGFGSGLGGGFTKGLLQSFGEDATSLAIKRRPLSNSSMGKSTNRIVIPPKLSRPNANKQNRKS
jgi:hypothetical protein